MNKTVSCRCCGEACDTKLDYMCYECYMELRFGVIKCQNIHFPSGSIGPQEDDGGPWQQNAIRDMEEINARDGGLR